jgi:hypothetical protein
MGEKVFYEECLLSGAQKRIQNAANVQFGYANVYQWRTYVLHESIKQKKPHIQGKNDLPTYGFCIL